MSNNQNKSYLVLPGGKECKKVNPFPFPKFGRPGDFSVKQYNDFELYNYPMPLTEVMPEGEMFSGNLDWYHFDGQSWNIQTDEQMALSPVAKNYASFFKQMVSPLKAKEPEKKDAGSYLMLANVAGKEQDGINPALLSLWSNIEIWYGDIKKLESCRNFLIRMQSLYSVRLRKEDTGSLVNNFKFLKKLYPDAPLLDVVENKEETVEDFIRENLLHGKTAEAVRMYARQQSHHNHASFVALVEGEIKNVEQAIDDAKGMFTSNNKIRLDTLTDLLNKIK